MTGEPQECQHRDMAFNVVSVQVLLVKCMECETQARVRPDASGILTTMNARNALFYAAISSDSMKARAQRDAQQAQVHIRDLEL